MNGEERLRVRARSDRYVHRRDAGDESFRLLSAASMSADDVPALLDEIDRQISTLHGVLMGAAEDYRQCIVAARASMSDADYQRCNGRAEAYRQAATRLAESSGLPIPDWDRIRREVPADGVYRQATPAAAAEGSAEGGTSKGSGSSNVPTEGGAHP